MGMDELKPNEVHEVTLQLKGPCRKPEARRYIAALRKCWRDLAEQGFPAQPTRRIIVRPPKRRRPSKRRRK